MENQQSRTDSAARGAEVMNEVKNKASEVAQEVKQQGQEQFESRKHTAADQTEKLADVVDRAANELREQDQQSIADYASQLAGSMKNFADGLRGRSLDDLIQDTQNLARNNPTLFMAGSVAVGIALSRFFKASANRSRRGRGEDYDAGGATGLERQPATFESRPSVISESVSPTPSAGTENPSFGDNAQKGV